MLEAGKSFVKSNGYLAATSLGSQIAVASSITRADYP